MAHHLRCPLLRWGQVPLSEHLCDVAPCSNAAVLRTPMCPGQVRRCPWREATRASAFASAKGDDSQRSPDEIRIIVEMLQVDLERFLSDNRIDAPAARELRSEAPHVQLAVMDRGPLLSCVNPSGVLGLLGSEWDSGTSECIS